MRKIAEKVAIVAQICIALVFVLTTALYMTGTIPYNNEIVDSLGRPLQTEDGSIMAVLLFVLAALFAALSVFILYVNFSEKENLRQILLFCDSDSATHTNIKVLNNIVHGCSKQVDGIDVKKVKVRADEKGGFVATVFVNANAETVAESVNKLRCLLADSFKNTLGLTFNTINFQVKRLNGRYLPDVQHAEQLANTLEENQAETAENYQQPLE